MRIWTLCSPQLSDLSKYSQISRNRWPASILSYPYLDDVLGIRISCWLTHIVFSYTETHIIILREVLRNFSERQLFVRFSLTKNNPNCFVSSAQFIWWHRSSLSGSKVLRIGEIGQRWLRKGEENGEEGGERERVEGCGRLWWRRGDMLIWRDEGEEGLEQEGERMKNNWFMLKCGYPLLNSV